jgi:ubiquinone/menaquinone biosynthesis C-methylase UbiE
MDLVINALKAAGEPTRLRILAAVGQSELTVTDLCRVLGQSQPRVSRHLKLLCDAQLLSRHAEGVNAYFGPPQTEAGRRAFLAVQSLIPTDDSVLDRDAQRLRVIRDERANHASVYFETVASEWDRMRGLHVADVEVERAMLSAVERLNPFDLLDIGTGTGRILELFAQRVTRAVGIDASREMLSVARSHIEQKDLRNCTVRLGNVYDLRVPSLSFDVAVLHHVLHFLDDPAAAIIEASRSLRPGGRLLIVDFSTHAYELLRSDFAHRRLGFADEEISLWCKQADLVGMNSQKFEHKTENGQVPLTITLWSAERFGSSIEMASTRYNMEVAS